MAKNGLKKWFAQKWVDIGSKRKDGSFAKCGRSKQKADAKRKYPNRSQHDICRAPADRKSVV